MENHRFKHSDTTLVAFLLTSGYSILKVEQDPDTLRINFTVDISKDDPKLVQLIGVFYAGQANVEPTEFSQNYRNLVNMTRQAKGGNNG